MKVNYVYNINCIMIGNKATCTDAHVETYPEVLSMDDAVKKATHIMEDFSLTSMDICDAETGEILIQLSAESDPTEVEEPEPRGFLYKIPVPDGNSMRDEYAVGDSIRIGPVVGEIAGFGGKVIYIASEQSPESVGGFSDYFLYEF